MALSAKKALTSSCPVALDAVNVGTGCRMWCTTQLETGGQRAVAGKLEGKVAFITGVTLPVDAGFTNKR